MGPQFAHIQTFSRKRNGAGQSVEQVFGELTREASYSHHVPEPAPPGFVHGISPAQLRAEHDAMINAAREKVHIQGKVRERAVREDRHTLATAIASYPRTLEEIGKDPDQEKALRAWEVANVAFFRKLFGAHYRATYRHTDEPYPHLHIYALPVGLNGIDAKLLHPGKAAKTATEARCKAEGMPLREAVAASNRALKSAMRDWQDRYYREVGEPCGLLRTGPRRERLSRAQYKARQAEALLRSTSVLEKRKALLEEAGREMHIQIAALEAANRKLAEREQEIAAREAALHKKDAQLATAVRLLREAGVRMRRIVAAVAVFMGLQNARTIEGGLAAIEDAIGRIESTALESIPDLPETRIAAAMP